MGKGVAVLIVFASKPFRVVFAGDDGTLLRAFRLVRKYMSLQVLENTTAFRVRTAPLFLVLVIVANTASGGAIPRTPSVCRGHRGPSLV